MNELASVYVLNATANAALSVSGSSTVSVPGTIQVASSSSSAIVLSGNSRLTASTIGVFGGTSVSGSSSFGVTPTKDTTAPTDPLASLPVPSATGLTTYAAVNLGGSSSLTISPGIYPSISVGGSGKLTMQPGIYVITGGGFSRQRRRHRQRLGRPDLQRREQLQRRDSGSTFGAFAIERQRHAQHHGTDDRHYAGIALFQSRDNSQDDVAQR